MIVLTTYFNPGRYQQIRKNYDRFADDMANQGVKLATIELVLDDDEQVSDSFTYGLVVRGTRSANTLWQKERLLNLGIQKFADESRYLAWIDADVVFFNPNWYAEAEAELQNNKVVQLFSDPYWGTATHSLMPAAQSCGFRWSTRDRRTMNFTYSHPGFAWAGHSTWLKEIGLYDRMITGSGDSFMISGFTGLTSKYHTKVRDGWQLDFHSWKDRCFSAIGGSFGFVNGAVLHMYHGSLKNRQYAERFDELLRLGYDPLRDVYIDDNGLLAWTPDARPTVRSWVERYFSTRKDDN